METFDGAMFEELWIWRNFGERFCWKRKGFRRRKQKLDQDQSLNENGFVPYLSIGWIDSIGEIFHAKTAKKAWSILIKTYKGVDLVKGTRLQGLKR